MKRFKINEIEEARVYAREKDMYICIYMKKEYIECDKLTEEEIRYIACDMLLDSKGNVIYNSLLRIEPDSIIIEEYNEENDIVSIVDDIIEKEGKGYRIDNYIVHGNNESMQIEYIK